MQLETRNLILRVPIEADLDAWAALDSDAVAMRFLGGPRNRAQAWMGLAAAAGMWSLRGFGLFSVLDRASGRWIGRVGPWCPEGAPGTEIGWALARSSWGRGHAGEAAGAATAWAFETLGWTELIHCIDAENLPSIAVAHRLGSRWCREELGAYGKMLQIYGQSRAEWRARSKNPV